MPIKNATIPDKFLHAIGKVTFNFSGLEYAIKRLTWKLIGISDLAVVDCITANLSFKALTDLASSLLKIRSQNATILQEADTLFKQLLIVRRVETELSIPIGRYLKIKMPSYV